MIIFEAAISFENLLVRVDVLEKKGKVEVLQQLLGHSDISTTMIYAHITDKTQKTQILAAFESF